MSQTYGIESAKDAVSATKHEGEGVRYVIVIESGEDTIARLLLSNHQQIDEIDAGASEVVQLIQGISPQNDALGEEWDDALKGHSDAERRAAQVYILDI